MPQPYTIVIGLEVHVQLAHRRGKDVLRLQHAVRRAAEHANLPRVHRPAGHAAHMMDMF